MTYLIIWLICGLIAMGILVVDDFFIGQRARGTDQVIYWAGVVVGILFGCLSLILLIVSWKEVMGNKGRK